MIEIIKESHDKRYLKCQNCGSILSFDDRDVYRHEMEDNILMSLDCPVCGWENIEMNYSLLDNSIKVFSVDEKEYIKIMKNS
jgi:RNase P subunit RPR2